MVLPVVPMKFSPNWSPIVSISPHLSPLVLKLVGKTMKIDSVVCLWFGDHLAPYFSVISTSKA